jgi:hypothetical protein
LDVKTPTTVDDTVWIKYKNDITDFNAYSNVWVEKFSICIREATMFNPGLKADRWRIVVETHDGETENFVNNLTSQAEADYVMKQIGMALGAAEIPPFMS